jgi:hypothetical protein
MGSKGGGMTPTGSSLGFQSSTSTTTPDPRAASAYTNVLDRAQNVANTPYQGYGGQLVAGFSPDQTSAFQGVRNAQGIADPYIDQATGLVNQSLALADPSRFNEQSLSQYYNPYQQQVIDATMANIRQQNAIQQNDLTGDAIMKGYMGGDRAGIARAALAGQQAMAANTTLANLQRQGYQDAVNQYNQQQQTALGAAQQGVGALGNLGTLQQNSTMQGLQALLGVGGQQQQLSQQQLDALYQQWQQAQNFPYQQTQWLAGITGGIAPNLGGTTNSVGFGMQQQSQPQPSTLGQIAGAGLSALSFLPKIFKDGGRVARPNGGLIPLDDKAPFAGGSWIPDIKLSPAHTDYPTPPKVDMPSMGETKPQDTGLGALTKGVGSMSRDDVQKVKSGLGRILNPDAPIQLTGASPQSGLGDFVAPVKDDLGGLYADGGRVAMFRGGEPSADDDIDRYLAALARGESGGEKDPYSAIGPLSRRGDHPYGKYQVMGENVPVWSKEAGLGALTPQQFLADRDAQEAVARHKFGQYLRETGSPQEAAAMWLGGPNYKNHPRARDVLGTDVAKYVDTFNRNVGEDRPLGFAGAAEAPSVPSPIRVADSGVTMNDARPAAPAERTGLGSMWSPEVQQGLLAAGLGMLASRSPNFGTALGEGGLRGLGAYNAAQETAADVAKQRLAQLRLDANQALEASKLAEEKRWHDLQARRQQVTEDLKSIPNQNRQREAEADRLGLQGRDRVQYIVAGTLPRTNDAPLTATDKKAILEADDRVAQSEVAIDLLTKAKDISKQAYGGVGAGARSAAGVNLPDWMVPDKLASPEKSLATQDLQNLTTQQALESLKAIFGGNPTEGERAILLDIQGSVNKPDEIRQKIYDRGLELARRRLDVHSRRAAELRGGEFYKPKEEAPPAPVVEEVEVAPKPVATSKYKEGDVAVNKSTGEKLVFKGGKWEKSP